VLLFVKSANMSLMPWLSGRRDSWDSSHYAVVPSFLHGQNFGMGIVDEMLREMDRIERASGFRPSLRDLQRQMMTGPEWTGRSEVVNDANRFAINIDVSHFKPEEIKVKMLDDKHHLVIEGSHQERADEHGYVARSFQRRYVLPKDIKVDQLKSHLTSDGLLTIEAPKMNTIEGAGGKAREIPIETVPHAAVKPPAINNQQNAKK